MPCAARKVFRSRPKASSPSRPISVVGAPSLAAATAWLAPLPPGKYSTELPATVSPIFGCRLAVATTSMLMLPATNTPPIALLPGCQSVKKLDADGKLLPDRFDIGKGRQSGLVAETLNLEGGSGAREFEMIVPALVGIAEVGIDIGAVEHVAGAVGVEHALARDRKRRQRMHHAGLVVP